MRLSIMQPYFLPYIGYFQLMAAADELVLLDDVNFINRGWINRNRIGLNGNPHWLTLPLVKASQNRLINELEIVDDQSWRNKMMRTVQLSYAQAPFAPQILPLFSEMLTRARGSLSAFLFYTLRQVAYHIGINAEIEPTSAIYPKEGRTGEERILDICARKGATGYLNLPGGRNIYNPESFARAGIDLLFLDSNLPSLPLRLGTGGEASLSILDLLMHNSPATLREAVHMFVLDRI